MRTFLLYLIGIGLFFCCSSPKEKIPDNLMTPDQTQGKMVVYQMMTRLFGNKDTLNRTYGTIQENGVGKFNDISEAALKSLKDLGITHVWYTGVIETCILTDYTAYGIPLDDGDVVKGRAGTPYTIKDYYDINPDFALNVRDRMKEFDSLVSRTHKQGLKVIIDFVPNHVARAYKSDAKPAGVKDFGENDNKNVAFAPGNNFYYLPGQTFQVPKGFKPLGENVFPTLDGKFEETPAKVTGNDQFTAKPGVNDWFETIKLNYGVDIQNGRKSYFDPVPDTWNKMRDILLFWAVKNIDGFRCDMAEMVPVEFWQWVIPQVKAVNPELFFIAEIYNPAQYRNYIQTGKFDFLYDKVQLYDTLRFLMQGKRSTADIAEVQRSLSDINQHMLHFMENHDEQRLASRFFAGDMWKGVPAMVISATIDRAPVMIYFGQEVGEPALGQEGFQGDDGRTTIFDYWGVPEHQKWMNGGKFDGALLSADQKKLRQLYSDLLNLAKTNPAITHGAYEDVTALNISKGNFNDKVHAFVRYAGDDKLLIVSSFNTAEQQVKIQLPDEVIKKLQFDNKAAYTGRDLLGREAQLTFGQGNFTIELKLKPYSSYIFKIQQKHD